MKQFGYILSFIVFTLLAMPLSAQRQKLKNRPYADQRDYHLGFTLGMHTQDLMLSHSGFVNKNGEVWFSEIPYYSPGFTVGIIGDMYLNRYINLRIIPTLHLGDKNFVFKEQHSGTEYDTQVKNNYIMLPIQVKLSANRVNNYKPYAILGGYGSVELGSRKGEAILLKPFDYGIEVGFGCDFYLPLFTLSPELKFCFGLADMLEKKRPDIIDKEMEKYTLSLSRATQRLIVLSFNFE